MIFLAILLVGFWLVRQAKNIKAALAISLVTLVLMGIAVAAG